MRKVNAIHFSVENEKGLTQSSANFLANMSSEQVARDDQLLMKINFVDTKIAIIGHQDQILSEKGITEEDFNKIPELIEKIGKLKAFSAWIRESIKAKDIELKDAKSYAKSQWIAELGIVIPEMPELPTPPEKPELQVYPEKPAEPREPALPNPVTEDDIKETWTVKERARYWEVEAMASTYGKLIHQDGAINIARDTLHERVAGPVKAEGSGRETVVEYYAPSIPVEKVDALFNMLQDRYRSYEKELNSMKFRLKESMEKLTQERQAAYRESIKAYNAAMEEWNNQMVAWRAEADKIDLTNLKLTEQYQVACDEHRKQVRLIKSAHQMELQKIQSDFESYQSNLVNEVSKLKIRIPESLLGIFHELDSLGKSE